MRCRARVVVRASLRAAQAPLAPPLGSVPLTGQTGLRLVVPSTPPFIYDVDSGRVTVLREIPTRKLEPVRAVGVGSAAVVASDPGPGEAGIYAVTRSGRAQRIGTGGQVVAAAGGRAVWLKTRRAAGDCRLRRVRLDGRTTAGPAAVSCSAHLTDFGLLAQGGLLRDPLTRRVVARTPAWTIARSIAVGEAFFGRPLSLTNLSSGEVRQLPWPSEHP